MSLFKKRKNNEAFKIQLEREAMDKINHPELDGLSFSDNLGANDSAWSINGKVKSPHTITAEELNGKQKQNFKVNTSVPSNENSQSIPMSQDSNSNISSSDFLYSRMLHSRNQTTEKAIANTKEKTESFTTADAIKNNDIKESNKITSEPIKEVNEKPNEPLDIDAAIKSLKESINKGTTINESNIAAPDLDSKANNSNDDFIKQPDGDVFAETTNDSCSDNDNATQNKKTKFSKTLSAEQRRTSLLARCNAYLEDDEFGSYKPDTDKYKLESVESILEDFESRATQRINKKFNAGKAVAPTIPTSTETSEVKSVKESVVSEPTKTISLADLISVLEEKADAKTVEEIITEPAHSDTAKHYFVADTTSTNTEESDDSNHDIFSTKIVPPLEDISSTSSKQTLDQTNIFTPIDGAVVGKHINNINETAISEDNDNSEVDDYITVNDKERILNSLLKSKKRLTIRCLATVILLIPSVLLLTPFSDSITKFGMMPAYIIDLILCIFAIVSNFNVIKSILSLFNNQNDPDLPAALATIFTALFSAVNLAINGMITGFSAVVLTTLLFHNIAKRIFYSRAVKNLELIANTEHKRAVSIVKNKAVTKAIVGESIEGSSLICCGVETTNLHNFLKYTYCSNPVAGKIKNIAIIGIFLALGFGLATAVLDYNNLANAFKNLSATLCIAAAPSALFLTILPFRIADTRLKLYDAMITGYRAADELDLCNGVAINCSDLFPEGSIRLVDMKLLSPNPFDQSILDAAALAETIGSPLSGIFKQVNITSSYKTEKPTVDSVAYEEKMGISGWVNDRRVFVGNRILMEAHGFASLPPIELDKKIMRKGYFPIYLASDNIPCALFVVKYTPDEDITYELRRLCNTGATVLVHNCDPNISDKMLCDYFGVHDETIFVMSKHGSEQYKILTSHKENRSSGASYKHSACGIFSIITASINIKKLISIMTAIYIICTVLGFLALGISIFASIAGHITPLSLLIYNLVATVITCLPPLISKP